MFKSVLLIVLGSSLAMADTGFKDSIQFTEIDGSPKCMAGQVKVTNGTLACNGQTATITTGGGTGGLTYVKDTSSDTISSADFEFQSNSIGPVLRDSANCAWRTTVNTSGNLVTSLLGCPSVPATPVDTCTTGQPRGLLLALVCP